MSPSTKASLKFWGGVSTMGVGALIILLSFILGLTLIGFFPALLMLTIGAGALTGGFLLRRSGYNDQQALKKQGENSEKQPIIEEKTSTNNYTAITANLKDIPSSSPSGNAFSGQEASQICAGT